MAEVQMQQAPEQSPGIAGQNPFQLIAYLLFKVRHSLEDDEEAGRAPRWVRMARVREAQGDSDYIGLAVMEGINGFAETISYMLELTLDLRELLVQTDAGKALVEVGLDLIYAAANDKFRKGVEALVGPSTALEQLGEIKGKIANVEAYMGYIPDPDDVEGMGNQLYRLLCIEQFAIPVDAKGIVDESLLTKDTSEHIIRKNSGKLRLMQWALGSGTTVHGLGPINDPESAEHEVFRLGGRRLWQTQQANLPTASLLKWAGGGTPETLVDFFYGLGEDDSKRMLDLEEVHKILAKLGYKTEPAVTVEEEKQFSPKLGKMLRQFQKINDLPMHGMLDNPTLNRLFHLDYANKNIARAKPYDETRLDPTVDDLEQTSGIFPLVNPDADHWRDEGLKLAEEPLGYRYYVAGREFSGDTLQDAPGNAEQMGWISDNNDGGDSAVPGFVGVQSRVIHTESSSTGYQFDGDLFSEGEAASPFMFFAARLVEPWEPGRFGQPGSNALFGGSNPKPGVIHRLYQWIDLQAWMAKLTSGYELRVQASVKIRSLWSDRNRKTKLSDQGRIALELYKKDVFTGNRAVKRDKTKFAVRGQTVWYPPHAQMVEDARALEEIKRKRNWRLCKTEWLTVPTGMTGALVLLEGRHQSGWDTDAYFDDVSVSYKIEKKTTV